MTLNIYVHPECMTMEMPNHSYHHVYARFLDDLLSTEGDGLVVVGSDGVTHPFFHRFPHVHTKPPTREGYADTPYIVDDDLALFTGLVYQHERFRMHGRWFGQCPYGLAMHIARIKTSMGDEAIEKEGLLKKLHIEYGVVLVYPENKIHARAKPVIQLPWKNDYGDANYQMKTPDSYVHGRLNTELPVF